MPSIGVIASVTSDTQCFLRSAGYTEEVSCSVPPPNVVGRFAGLDENGDIILFGRSTTFGSTATRYYYVYDNFGVQVRDFTLAIDSGSEAFNSRQSLLAHKEDETYYTGADGLISLITTNSVTVINTDSPDFEFTSPSYSKGIAYDPVNELIHVYARSTSAGSDPSQMYVFTWDALAETYLGVVGLAHFPALSDLGGISCDQDDGTVYVSGPSNTVACEYDTGTNTFINQTTIAVGRVVRNYGNVAYRGGYLFSPADGINDQGFRKTALYALRECDDGTITII